MLDFFKNRRVFLTGHTGFKGMWLAKILTMSGARVTGFALAPAAGDTENVFRRMNFAGLNSVIGDVRDLAALKKAFGESRPEIVIHMAAQPIVLTGYKEPVATYETNVMGTVNVLECVRLSDTVRVFLNVTTDKVYLNREWFWGYREDERLGGFDPYSNSKSCSELVTLCYKNSFFADGAPAVCTARAGNVIGGGDFSPDRIIPDCVRAACAGEKIILRNPDSVRPYQHVLDALGAYLTIVQAAFADKTLADSYNVGPDERDIITTGELADIFVKLWNEPNVGWVGEKNKNARHEANFLRLDSTKIKSVLGWRPKLNIEETVGCVVDWTKAWRDGEDIAAVTETQIKKFFEQQCL